VADYLMIAPGCLKDVAEVIACLAKHGWQRPSGLAQYADDSAILQISLHAILWEPFVLNDTGILFVFGHR